MEIEGNSPKHVFDVALKVTTQKGKTDKSKLIYIFSYHMKYKTVSLPLLCTLMHSQGSLLVSTQVSIPPLHH